MKRDTDWTDALRSELRDAELTPPDRGWERLQEELSASGATVPKRIVPQGRTVRLGRFRIAVAAAAAVVICIVAGEWWWQTERIPDRDGSVVAGASDESGNARRNPERSGRPFAEESRFGEADEASVVSDVFRFAGSGESSGLVAAAAPKRGQEPATGKTSFRSLPVERKLASISVRSHGRIPVSTQHASYAVGGPVSEGALPSAESAEAFRSPEAAGPAERGDATRTAAAGQAVERASGSDAPRSAGNAAETASDGVQTRSNGHAQSADRVVSGRTEYADPSDRLYAAHTRPRNKASFGLFAGGGVTGGNSGRMQPGGVLMSDVSSSPGGQVSALKRPDYGKESYRHHQPLGFGLSVRKEFAYGLSLESGVVYTLLRSDVRLRYASEDIGQRLHFIGVPLRMNWRFLQRGGFSLYMGAGGMIEKCVSAEVGSRSVREAGVQGSVLAAAGAEYRFAGPFGLYFEPEASYYFTRTSLPTARTESPLTWTLRLGVRLSF